MKNSIINSFVGLLVFIFITFFVILFVNQAGFYYKEEVVVDISSLDVEKAIPVRAMNNLILERKSIGFGGGVGAGIGSAEVYCLDLKQFVKLTEKCQVYTFLEKKDPDLLIRKYVAFMENGNGLFVYEKNIEFPLSEKGKNIKNGKLYLNSSMRIISFDEHTATAFYSIKSRKWF